MSVELELNANVDIEPVVEIDVNADVEIVGVYPEVVIEVEQP